MLILGIDPGTATTGFGVIDVEKDNFEVVDFGLVETDKDGTPGKRLFNIHKQIINILTKYNPDIFAIEMLFFATNAKTAIRVGQAQGVMLLAAASQSVKVVEYAPGTIKKVITGNGRADKKMIQKYVRKMLGPKVRSRVHKKTHFDNAADALAIALTHAFNTDALVHETLLEILEAEEEK